MKAAVLYKYGSPSDITITDISKPKPKKGEVLVDNYAASINSWDVDMISGRPFLYRLLHGIWKPKYPVIGIDCAGIVVELGEGATQFKIGDRVFGDASESFGTFAQYVSVPEKRLALMDEAMSFNEAASLPHSAQLAYQSLYEKISLGPGDEVLINGAGGCVGTLMIPLVKNLGAKLTCVDSAEKEALLRDLGTDDFIDYKKIDFTKQGKKHDLIVDLVSNRKVFAYRNCLKSDGILKIVGGKVSSILSVAFMGSILSAFSHRKYGMLAYKAMHDVGAILELYKQGCMRPFISKIYSLEQIPEALTLIAQAKSQGKIVIEIPKE